MASWPGPIAAFMPGRIDEEALLGSIHAHPSLRARETCQVHFFLGLKRLLAGDEVGYLGMLPRCLDLLPVSRLGTEYHLARGELLLAGR